MYGKMKDHLSKTLAEIKEAGLYKEERLIESAQQAAISVKGKEVLNFCANNYLGLSNHPRLIAAAQQIMEHRGYGMSSVRFICGTQDIHKELEAAISDYFKTEDTILYAACFDANGGGLEPRFTEEDAGYSPWTATLPRWTEFATLPRNTTRWSWWTNHTLPVW